MYNQEAKADKGKLQLTLVPRQIIREIAKVRMYGTEKYKDPENWKRVEVERYRDAAFRHFLAYLDSPYSVDEESRLPHLSHLACNIAFLCELDFNTGMLGIIAKCQNSANDAAMDDEKLFKKLADLENAYVAGHITMDTYLNEYNKMVNEKREKEKQDEKTDNDTLDYITFGPDSSIRKKS